jgi:outer membrane protein
MKFFIAKIIFFFLIINISSANENIRFININYIVNNSNAGKVLNNLIEKKSKKFSNELNKIGKSLEDKKNKIISQKNILKKEEFEKLIKEYDIEVKNFNEKRKKKTNELNNFTANSKKKILDLLNPLIKDYLKKESVQILLQKEKIIFGDEKLDITKEILDIFNGKHKNIKFE